MTELTDDYPTDYFWGRVKGTDYWVPMAPAMKENGITTHLRIPGSNTLIPESAVEVGRPIE